ncbi:MAG: septal ring lytic transglycosylase RlpA family protein [Burkholderiaceae bacterium]
MLRFLSIASIALSALAPLAVEAKSSCGIASWYGPGFHGNLTASGERFNSRAFTAAHKSLPFGSRVKVTNQVTGRSVTIKINDDGPHVPGRIIDLSEGAFARIASLGQGVAKVCISKV